MGVLDGRVAIVTGSARGIGRATAELLAEQGARVVINDLERDLAQQTAAEIGGEAVVYGFQKMLDIHTVVPFRVLRAAAPHLREPAKRERAAGEEVFRKVVNVSSTSGIMGNAGQANYAAGKAAVVGLTKTLAKEWGQFKINVNAVAFGYIDTRLTQPTTAQNTMHIDGETVQLGIPEPVREATYDLIPLGRPGTPEEAAGGVFFLCSPWSNYVHGQVLMITGGIVTGMAS